MMRKIGWLAMVLVVFALVGCQSMEKSGDKGPCCDKPACEKAACDKAKCDHSCDPAKCPKT